MLWPDSRDAESFEHVLGVNNLKILTCQSEILTLPLAAKVLVQSPHLYSLAFFTRLDLKVIHVVRGGGSLKIGWKTDNRSKWYTWLRLWRRNAIVLSSRFFFDDTLVQERVLPYQKLYSCQEPRVTQFIGVKRERTNTIKNVLIALGDRAGNNDYLELDEILGSKYNLINSIHPSASVDLESETYNWNEIDLVILDKTVSMTMFLAQVDIPFIVLRDRFTGRELAYSAEDLYHNMCDVEQLVRNIEYKQFTKMKVSFEKKTLDSLITKSN